MTFSDIKTSKQAKNTSVKLPTTPRNKRAQPLAPNWLRTIVQSARSYSRIASWSPSPSAVAALMFFSNLKKLREVDDRVKKEISVHSNDVEGISKDVNDMVTTQFDEIYRLLDLKKKQVLKDLENWNSKKIKEHQVWKQMKDSHKKTIENFLKDCEEIVDECDPECFLKVACDLNTRVKTYLDLITIASLYKETPNIKPTEIDIKPTLDAISALHITGDLNVFTDPFTEKNKDANERFTFKDSVKQWKEPKNADSEKYCELHQKYETYHQMSSDCKTEILSKDDSGKPTLQFGLCNMHTTWKIPKEVRRLKPHKMIRQAAFDETSTLNPESKTFTLKRYNEKRSQKMDGIADTSEHNFPFQDNIENPQSTPSTISGTAQNQPSNLSNGVATSPLTTSNIPSVKEGSIAFCFTSPPPFCFKVKSKDTSVLPGFNFGKSDNENVTGNVTTGVGSSAVSTVPVSSSFTFGNSENKPFLNNVTGSVITGLGSSAVSTVPVSSSFTFGNSESKPFSNIVTGSVITGLGSSAVSTIPVSSSCTFGNSESKPFSNIVTGSVTTGLGSSAVSTVPVSSSCTFGNSESKPFSNIVTGSVTTGLGSTAVSSVPLSSSCTFGNSESKPFSNIITGSVTTGLGSSAVSSVPLSSSCTFGNSESKPFSNIVTGSVTTGLGPSAVSTVPVSSSFTFGKSESKPFSDIVTGSVTTGLGSLAVSTVPVFSSCTFGKSESKPFSNNVTGSVTTGLGSSAVSTVPVSSSFTFGNSESKPFSNNVTGNVTPGLGSSAISIVPVSSSFTFGNSESKPFSNNVTGNVTTGLGSSAVSAVPVFSSCTSGNSESKPFSKTKANGPLNVISPFSFVFDQKDKSAELNGIFQITKKTENAVRKPEGIIKTKLPVDELCEQNAGSLTTCTAAKSTVKEENDISNIFPFSPTSLFSSSLNNYVQKSKSTEKFSFGHEVQNVSSSVTIAMNAQPKIKPAGMAESVGEQLFPAHTLAVTELSTCSFTSLGKLTVDATTGGSVVQNNSPACNTLFSCLFPTETSHFSSSFSAISVSHTREDGSATKNSKTQHDLGEFLGQQSGLESLRDVSNDLIPTTYDQPSENSVKMGAMCVLPAVLSDLDDSDEETSQASSIISQLDDPYSKENLFQVYN
uniref:Flocculation protein FLO11-like isoform X2 n=1 Tax=Geotrypetes seraphini TaxID=260995 RepID=A0A6P8QPQ5_GEOSA|nr:flocculation protein FLO11-like isoform X2 [Geotrypetes seraphini]